MKLYYFQYCVPRSEGTDRFFDLVGIQFEILQLILLIDLITILSIIQIHRRLNSLPYLLPLFIGIHMKEMDLASISPYHHTLIHMVLVFSKMFSYPFFQILKTNTIRAVFYLVGSMRRTNIVAMLWSTIAENTLSVLVELE